MGRRASILIAAACLAFGLTQAATAREWPVVQSSGPERSDFFRKYVDCGGIAVRSSAAVADSALRLACDKIATMLKNIPKVRSALVQRGAELHVIGRNEVTSDLPEFRQRRGVLYTDNRGRLTTIDERTRGMGGLLSSCGEENILHLPDDRYEGQDVCIHEFAHAIMDYGISAKQRQAIYDQYAKAMSAALWHNAYAATNGKEYWAELSMWYFGSHGARRRGSDTPEGDGPEALRRYDPGGFSRLQATYGGIE